jgi:hypothetical protein
LPEKIEISADRQPEQSGEKDAPSGPRCHPAGEDRFADDSPLEESGFEPLVPLAPRSGSDAAMSK